MSRIKDSIRRYFILSKRLLYKKGFLAILLLVPILVAAMGIAAESGGSILTVALAMEDNEDPLACEITDQLVEESSLLRFVLCSDPDEAIENVRSGEADAAWIFGDELSERIDKFSKHTHRNNAFVTVVQREESVFLRLSHEKLNAAIYPYLSLAIFNNTVRNSIDEDTRVSYDKFYHEINADGADLFDFVYANEGKGDEVAGNNEGNFLISPLRGLLAIMVILGGVAVAMFYMQDEARGLFDRFPRSAGFSFSLAYHTSAVLMVGAVVLVGLMLTGISVGVGYEMLALAVYCLTSVGFCMCLRLILRDIRLFGAIAPVLIVVMAVLCPIFFLTPKLPAIQHLLPTYYYLNAFSNSNYVWYMALYGIALHALAFLLHFLRAKQRK